MLRRQSQEEGVPLVRRDFFARVASYIESLESTLRRSKREHGHCDDSWYCCGKCQHPDHMLHEGEYLDSHDGEAARVSGVCNCGTDIYNKTIDNLLQDGELDAGKRSYSEGHRST